MVEIPFCYQTTKLTDILLLKQLPSIKETVIMAMSRDMDSGKSRDIDKAMCNVTLDIFCILMFPIASSQTSEPHYGYRQQNRGKTTSRFLRVKKCLPFRGLYRGV